MRLFTGIALDPGVRITLEQVLREMRPLAPLNWSPVENLHITSKFIGDWPEPKLGELKHALAQMPAPPEFTIAIARFGYLPDPRRPRMLVAGVEAGPELAELARRTEDAIEPLGIARETRPYTPHLTLARIGNKPIPAVREYIAARKAQAFGAFRVSAFHLYLSTPRLGGAGSLYRSLARFPLGSRS